MNMTEIRADWRLRRKAVWQVLRGQPLAYRLHTRNVTFGFHHHDMGLLVTDCLIEGNGEGLDHGVVQARLPEAGTSRWWWLR